MTLAGGRIALIAALLAAAVAPAGAGASSFAVTEGCDEQQAFVAGDDAGVAARLPKGYTAVREPSGAPVVFVRAIRCEKVTIGRESGPATMSSYGVVVESPDGRGCGSGGPTGQLNGENPPICNWYTLAWLADDRRVARWLRAGGEGMPAVYATDLAFRLGEPDPNQGGAPFAFRAAADGVRYGMEAVGRERPGTLAVRGGYWADAAGGTAKVAFSTQDLVSGDATGTVTAVAGTELAALLGADRREYLPGHSAFAAERWERAVYRRQLLAAGPDSHSFAGSCALEGNVAFTPPVTGEERDLRYEYTAIGRCTGTLDGREVEEEPVALRHAGPSFASCTRARTTAPGTGTLEFRDGTIVRYTLDFTASGTEVTFELYGERSGTARGKGTFNTQRTDPASPSKCGGEGLANAPLDMTFTTDSPLVGDDARTGEDGPRSDPSPGGGAGTRTGRAGSRLRLRLSATPRSARTGRRTAFVFRVRTRAGTPVAGALVRFAGRRARTGRAGRARIVVTLRRAGRRAARATMPGFRPARAAVSVR